MSAPLRAAVLLPFLAACKGGGERSHPVLEPPGHLARIVTLGERVPSFWNAKRDGLLPPVPKADAEALYEAPGTGASVGIVCRADFPGYRERPFIMRKESDAFADLTISVRLGVEAGAYEFRIDGEEDRNDRTFALPIAGLKKGDPIAFTFFDRNFSSSSIVDVLENDLEADGETFSLATDRKVGEVVCRGFDEGARAARLVAHEAEATAALDRIRAQDPVLDRSGFGKSESAFDGPREPLLAIVSLLGWDHPRASASTARFLAAESERDARFSAAFDAERAKVGNDVRLPNGYRVRIAGRGAAARVAVTNENERGSEERVSTFEAFTDVLDRACNVHRLVALAGSPQEIAAKATVTFELRPRPKGARAVAGPLLARGSIHAEGPPRETGRRFGPTEFSVSSE